MDRAGAVQQPDQVVQKGRLPRSVGTKDGHGLGPAQHEAHVTQGLGPVGIAE